MTHRRWRTRRTARCIRGLLPCVAAGALLTAGSGSDAFSGVSLKILNTRAPPGGAMQLSVTLTEPKPIITARASLSFGSAVLGPVMGVALYGPGGALSDVAGTAVVDGGRLVVRTTSPGADFGTAIATPILTVAIAVRPDAPVGAQSALALDPAGSLWLDPSGLAYPQQVKAGKFEVGGTISISDVFPGTGFLPAGSSVSVHGTGFVPGSIVEIDGVPIASTAFASSAELSVTLAAGADLYGRRVTVRNPDQSRAAYFAYLRAAWLGQSARPLLAATDPIFSPRTFSGAFFDSSSAPGQFFALALQNPGAAAAEVAVELRSQAAGSIASVALTLPPRTRISREVSELFGASSPDGGGFLVVRARAPIQMLGLLGDEGQGIVLPITAALSFP